jgi:hypothetical protein
MSPLKPQRQGATPQAYNIYKTDFHVSDSALTTSGGGEDGCISADAVVEQGVRGRRANATTSPARFQRRNVGD